jgi:hypothetical protein
MSKLKTADYQKRYNDAMQAIGRDKLNKTIIGNLKKIKAQI